MNAIAKRIKPFWLLIAALLLSQCRNTAHKAFTEQMLQGDWVPVDTAYFRKIPNNLFTALSLYNNKGGVPDTSYRIRHDSMFVKLNPGAPLKSQRSKNGWRFWRRIFDIRNDTLFLYRHSKDTMLVMANARLHAHRDLKLKRISFILSPSESSRPPQYGTVEISRDTVFAQSFLNPDKVFYCSGTKLLEYFEDKVQEINWNLTSTDHFEAPDKTDVIALIVETNNWTRDFCCYQNFRDPVFNQLMRQLDQLPSIVNLKALNHPHDFMKSKGSALKQKS